MMYHNGTFATVESAQYYIHSEWVHSYRTDFLKKEVLARAAYLILTPTSFLSTAIDTIIGLGVGFGAICTLGKHKQTFKVAYNHLKSSKLLARPYVNLLRTINPEARFCSNAANKPYVLKLLGLVQQPTISYEGNGLMAGFVIEKLKDIARHCYNSENCLKRHVVARLTYPLLAVSCLVTRAVDGIIAIPAASLSILTGGKFVFLNNLAYRTLQVTGIIDDLFYCTIKFINPWTGT